MGVRYYCSVIYVSYIKWILVSIVLKWANRVASYASYLCNICYVPFPEGTWTDEYVSIPSRWGADKKIHSHLSRACWSSKSVGVTHRTGATLTHPSIDNDSSGPHHFSRPHNSQTASSRSLLPFKMIDCSSDTMEEASKFPKVLVSFPSQSRRERFVCLEGSSHIPIRLFHTGFAI